MKHLRKCYAIGAAVILLCSLTSAARASTRDCISGPLGTGNPSGCTDADRKLYEEMQKEADAAALLMKAEINNCFKDPNAPPDKCPDEYRKIVDEAQAASKAKLQREYEIWLQGAEARKQEVKAKQEALLKRELAEIDAQYRAAAQQNYEDQMRRSAARNQEQQAELHRGVDDEVRRIDQYETQRAEQRTQQQTAERQVQQQGQQIAGQSRPAAPARRDPLTPAPSPAQTPESRRAAGLPDDPAAAACIQDDDCARALRSKH